MRLSLSRKGPIAWRGQPVIPYRRRVVFGGDALVIVPGLYFLDSIGANMYRRAGAVGKTTRGLVFSFRIRGWGETQDGSRLEEALLDCRGCRSDLLCLSAIRRLRERNLVRGRKVETEDEDGWEFQNLSRSDLACLRTFLQVRRLGVGGCGEAHYEIQRK